MADHTEGWCSATLTHFDRDAKQRFTELKQEADNSWIWKVFRNVN